MVEVEEKQPDDRCGYLDVGPVVDACGWTNVEGSWCRSSRGCMRLDERCGLLMLVDVVVDMYQIGKRTREPTGKASSGFSAAQPREPT